MTHVHVDCSTGKVSELTDAEAIAHPDIAIDGKEAAQAKAREADLKAAQQKRDVDLAAIKEKAKTDPAFAALARLLRLE